MVPEFVHGPQNLQIWRKSSCISLFGLMGQSPIDSVAKTAKMFYLSSGGRKPEINMATELVLVEGCEGRISFRPLCLACLGLALSQLPTFIFILF